MRPARTPNNNTVFGGSNCLFFFIIFRSSSSSRYNYPRQKQTDTRAVAAPDRRFLDLSVVVTPYVDHHSVSSLLALLFLSIIVEWAERVPSL